MVTGTTVQRQLETIAETYSRGWRPEAVTRSREPFARIEGRLTVPPSLAQDLGYGRQRIDIETGGYLFPAQQGFTMQLGKRICFHDNDQASVAPFVADTDYLYKAYSCDHVPVPSDW